jgi:glutathione S-transferase
MVLCSAYYSAEAARNRKNASAAKVGLLPNMMIAHGREPPTVVDQAALDYGCEKYGTEARRCLVVLDRHLASDGRAFLVGPEMTVADYALVPWISDTVSGTRMLEGMGVSLGETMLNGTVVDVKQAVGMPVVRSDDLPHLRAWLGRCIGGGGGGDSDSAKL